MVTTNSHGLHRPILVQFLLLLSSQPSTASMTDRHRHNGPSRVSFQNTSTLESGYWDHFSDLHDEPAGRTVTSFVIPHFVRLPHLPSLASLRCHLRTVTGTTDLISSVGGLFCIFRSKSLHSALDRFPAKQRETYIKNSTKKAFGHTKIKEKVLIIP